jgi:hypothetical protein
MMPPNGLIDGYGSPRASLGRPLVSRDFWGCHRPVNPGQLTAVQLRVSEPEHLLRGGTRAVLWNEFTHSRLIPGSVELRAVMNSPDQDTLIRAIEDARRILGEYIEPGPRDPKVTVERLIAVLDRNDVVHALDRIKRRRIIRLVE